MKTFGTLSVALVLAIGTADCRADEPGTPLEWSVRMADSEISRLGDTLAYKPEGKWDYAANVFALALLKLADAAKAPRYQQFVEQSIGSWVKAEGELQGFKAEDYNLDNINGGKVLLELFQRTGESRYRKAVDALRAQLRTHPRTAEGGFWHKKRYTSQMWLDGLYMGAPLRALRDGVRREGGL
jgi:unsaturated rhamnogalacturonyl hydrolase